MEQYVIAQWAVGGFIVGVITGIVLSFIFLAWYSKRLESDLSVEQWEGVCNKPKNLHLLAHHINQATKR